MVLQLFKSRAEQRVELEFGQDIAAVLRQLYHEEGLSQSSMAQRLKVHRTTVVLWMQRYEIPTGYNRDEAAS